MASRRALLGVSSKAYRHLSRPSAPVIPMLRTPPPPLPSSKLVAPLSVLAPFRGNAVSAARGVPVLHGRVMPLGAAQTPSLATDTFHSLGHGSGPWVMRRPFSMVGTPRQPGPTAAATAASWLSDFSQSRKHDDRRRGRGGSVAIVQGGGLSASLRPVHITQEMVPYGGGRGQARGFWNPREMRNRGVPVIIQIFYGTLLMVAIGVLALTVFSLSAGAAVLFLLGYAAYKVAGRQPQVMARALQHPYERTAMGTLFRPLMELMTESSLFEGLREVRAHIEDDVLRAINRHKDLGRIYGRDFVTVGHHKMSMQAVNGEKMVVLEFPVISTKPKELVVSVVAKQQPRQGQDVPQAWNWQYESVVVSPGDAPPVDLTDLVGKGASRNIVIDATARVKKTTEE